MSILICGRRLCPTYFTMHLKYSEKGKIEVTLKEVNSHFELSVAYTGIGISEFKDGKDVQRFHRLHNAEGRSSEGTGIVFP